MWTEREAFALRAMEELGFDRNLTAPILRKLLEVYNYEWGFIEADSYALLASQILDVLDHKRKGYKAKKVATRSFDKKADPKSFIFEYPPAKKDPYTSPTSTAQCVDGPGMYLPDQGVLWRRGEDVLTTVHDLLHSIACSRSRTGASAASPSSSGGVEDLTEPIAVVFHWEKGTPKLDDVVSYTCAVTAAPEKEDFTAGSLAMDGAPNFDVANKMAPSLVNASIRNDLGHEHNVHGAPELEKVDNAQTVDSACAVPHQEKTATSTSTVLVSERGLEDKEEPNPAKSTKE